MTLLAALPRIDRLLLAELELPDWHPAAADGRCLVFAYLVHHPDGAILVDTGVGRHRHIDDLYSPKLTSLRDALASHGVDDRDVAAVVNTHLHFDHCGQNTTFYELGKTPVYVQVAEAEAASQPGYTIPEWGSVPEEQLRLVDGDVSLAPGVRLLATPGHTPGHQSLVIEARDERVVIGGQCAWRSDELSAETPWEGNLHDESWREAAHASLVRIASFHPSLVYLSHDPSTFAAH